MGVTAFILLLASATHVLSQESKDTSDSFILKSEPAEVTRGLTSNVTITCREKEPTEGKKKFVVTHMNILHKKENGDGNWELLASIRNNEDQAVSEADYDNVVVTGNLADKKKMCFLKVSWTAATEDTFGVYRCTVVGFTPDYFVIAEETTEYKLTEAKVTAQGLLDYMLLRDRLGRDEVKEELKDFKEELDDLNKTVQGLSDQGDDLEARTNELERRVGWRF